MNIEGFVTLPDEPIVTAVMQSPEMAAVLARITALEGGVVEPPPIDPPPPPPPPPVPSEAGTITYRGREMYLHAAHAPWSTFEKDFGYGAMGLADQLLRPDGAVDYEHWLTQRIVQFADAGGNCLNFWMMENNISKHPRGPIQLTYNSSNKPNGINPKVYPDVDALLKLAEEKDFYVQLTVFTRHKYYPSGFFTPELANLLRPLFARYKDNPRLMCWVDLSEPEHQIKEEETANPNSPIRAQMIAFSQAFVQAVKEEAPDAMTSHNASMPDYLPVFKDVPYDFRQFSWYDGMNSNADKSHDVPGGKWCALCTTADAMRTLWGVTGPLVVGEFFSGETATYITNGQDAGPLGRLNAWYNKGFAGAFAWSINYDKTGDNMRIHWPAFAEFAATHDLENEGE